MIPKPFGLTHGYSHGRTHGKLCDGGKIRDDGIDLLHNLVIWNTLGLREYCRTIKTDGQPGRELESYVKRIATMARMASTAMVAPRISQSHQSPRRRAIRCLIWFCRDKVVFNRGVLWSAFSAPMSSSLGVSIATGYLWRRKSTDCSGLLRQSIAAYVRGFML